MTDHYQRDLRGQFTRNASPLTCKEITSLTPTLITSDSHPTHLQNIILVMVTLLTSSVPISEFVNNIAIAYYSTSEDSPLQRPNFNVSGSDGITPAAPSNSTSTLDNPYQFLPEHILEFQPSNDTPAYPHPLPPPPTQSTTPVLQHPQFLTIAPSCLTLPLPPLPTTHTPATSQRTMAHTSGLTAMPLAHSKHVPSFTGDINELTWDFIQEYEELADSCRLSDH